MTDTVEVSISNQLKLIQLDAKRVEEHFQKEILRVDSAVMDLREEVASLTGQVRRGNALNAQTQKEVMELRREAQTGFDGVHDSLVEVMNFLKASKNGNVP